MAVQAVVLLQNAAHLEARCYFGLGRTTGYWTDVKAPAQDPLEHVSAFDPPFLSGRFDPSVRLTFLYVLCTSPQQLLRACIWLYVAELNHLNNTQAPIASHALDLASNS